MACISFGGWIPYAAPPADEEDDDDESIASPEDLSHPPVTFPVIRGAEHAVKMPPSSSPHPRPRPPVVHPGQPKPPTVEKPVVPNPVPTKATSVITAFLRAQLGKPYAWGGMGPNAYDCSGLTKAAFQKVGISLHRTSEMQSLQGERVSLNDLRVGDLLFWGAGPGLAFHVAVYIGNGRYIGAQNPAVGVVERGLAGYYPNFARRVL